MMVFSLTLTLRLFGRDKKTNTDFGLFYRFDEYDRHLIIIFIITSIIITIIIIIIIIITTIFIIINYFNMNVNFFTGTLKCCKIVQKQLTSGVLRKRCSANMQQIYRRTLSFCTGTGCYRICTCIKKQMKSLEISISLVVQVAVDNEKYIFNIDILINCCRFRNISEYVEDIFQLLIAAA